MRKLVSVFFIALLAILSSCDKEESFQLDKVEANVEAKFVSDKQIVFPGDAVQFTNSSVYANNIEWTFEGGSPATSTEENPIVTYKELGSFKASLKISNEYGENVKEVVDFITVTDDAGWDNFAFPTIHFTNQTINENGALYKELIPNEQDFIKHACLKVCFEMFLLANDVNQVSNITYTVKDSETISAKGGSAPHIKIDFSSSYLVQKKNQGLSDEELIREIEGVLIHEITHGYQYEPQGAGGYESGTDFYGFIEGLADYVRYVVGFTPVSKRKAGGNWNDGYNTSAFFIDWLHSKDPKFIYKFNATAKNINPWSWEEAIKTVLGADASVSALWNEYQADIASGKISEIDADLKEMREAREKPEYTNQEPVADLIDVTDTGFIAIRDTEFDSPSGEEIGNIIDNNIASKFLIFTDNTWVRLESETSSVVSSYTLTSADDAPGRDPKKVTLSASNDGENWDVLDIREDVSFEERHQTKAFAFNNNKEYKYYKFDFENTDQGGIFQLAELELMGTKEGGNSGSSSETVDITDNSTATWQEEGFDFFDWGLPSFAFDNDEGTAFFNMNDNTWFTFATEAKHNVTKVAITATANILGIDYVFTPDTFVLEGSNDGENWSEITSVSETGIVAFEERKEFTFTNSEYYSYHRISMTAEIEEGDNKRIMIGELELFGTAE
ncbi:basic secretory protein-like protein [Marinifilum flexuosum]|uniref:basic secretory protein-like protein n=1 Tax=Marinifilum flexuosum TaxID=1117708 RepID=UPI0024915E68|nr:basic secretory protein-like protein [Marinifilum flexuosum]